MCPARAAPPGVAKVFKLSSNETPLGPSPRAIEAYKAVAAHLEDYPDGSASALREAIGRAFGLDPDRIVCGAGSDDLLNLLGARLSRRRRRGDPHHAWLSGLSDRDARHRREAGRRAGNELYRERRCDPGGGDEEDQDRLPRQSEQSDRHLHLLRRGQAAASRPAAAGAARARRGLRRICPAQRLRIRHRACRHQRQRRHDPHLLQNPRPRRLAARLDVWSGRMSSPRSTASAARSTSTRRRSPPASRRSRITSTRSARASTTLAGSPGWRRSSKSSG